MKKLVGIVLDPMPNMRETETIGRLLSEVFSSNPAYRSSNRSEPELREILTPFFTDMLHSIDEGGNKLPEALIVDFGRDFLNWFLKLESGTIPSHHIKPLSEDAGTVVTLDSLEENTPLAGLGSQHLSELVVMKLNGGLGTSMGITGPKSAIVVDPESGLTFLSAIAAQIRTFGEAQGADVGLCFMNSYNTSAETDAHLSKAGVSYTGFNQYRYPRIDISDPNHPKPFHHSTDETQNWAPPGHGDAYRAMVWTGFLKAQLDLGKRYMMIANADNLGATVNLSIFGEMIQSCVSVMPEVVSKTSQDTKGGSFVNVDGVLTLLEAVQVPKDGQTSFEKLPVFNTNTLWLNMQSLYDTLSNGVKPLPLIINPKVVDACNVVQLEHAVGAGISSLETAKVVWVDRSRFVPVKTTGDFLRLASDVFVKDSKTGQVYLNPARLSSLPNPLPIELGAKFKGISDYRERFKFGIPSLVAAESVVLKGDIAGDKGLVFQGHVHITFSDDVSVRILPGTCLCNVKITASGIASLGEASNDKRVLCERTPEGSWAISNRA